VQFTSCTKSSAHDTLHLAQVQHLIMSERLHARVSQFFCINVEYKPNFLGECHLVGQLAQGRVDNAYRRSSSVLLLHQTDSNGKEPTFDCRIEHGDWGAVNHGLDNVTVELNYGEAYSDL